MRVWRHEAFDQALVVGLNVLVRAISSTLNFRYSNERSSASSSPDSPLDIVQGTIVTIESAHHVRSLDQAEPYPGRHPSG